jgi:hypothetical protein
MQVAIRAARWHDLAMKSASLEVTPPEVKVVGKSGQISLGKKYAGKVLRLERLEDGAILLTSVAVVPERQLWTLQEPDRGRIARGLAWAAQHAPRETSLASLVRRRPRAKGAKGGRKAR